MVRAPIVADHFHGESGLGSLPVSEPEAPPADGHAVDFLVRTVMERPAGSVSLAVIGPMTNVAMAMVLEPAFAQRLGPVVFMGGARGEGGNITASAEYNVCADPHAAHVVFTSGVRPVVLGLDATHQVRATPERVAAIEALGTPVGDAAAELLRFAVATGRKQLGGDSPPLHDPCTIAWLLRPELFTAEPCRLDVEINSALTLGHTAVEFRLGQHEPNAEWVTRADGAGVFALLAERLGR
jgi:purine nucleosidase